MHVNDGASPGQVQHRVAVHERHCVAGVEQWEPAGFVVHESERSDGTVDRHQLDVGVVDVDGVVVREPEVVVLYHDGALVSGDLHQVREPDSRTPGPRGRAETHPPHGDGVCHLCDHPKSVEVADVHVGDDRVLRLPEESAGRVAHGATELEDRTQRAREPPSP